MSAYTPQPQSRFTMTNPFQTHHWEFQIYTTDETLVIAIQNFPGLTSVRQVGDYVYVWVDNNYDYQDVWLGLYYTLSELADFGATWDDAIDDALHKTGGDA